MPSRRLSLTGSLPSHTEKSASAKSLPSTVIAAPLPPVTEVPVPGTGTSVVGGSAGAMSVEGKDFADALLSVWLGKEPVSESLRDGMLGLD